MRFFSITKPGIIFGNVVTAAGGFFLGSKGHFNLWLFFSTLVGMALIVASGCVFNNIIDHDIDGIMERTQNRVLVKGLLSEHIAIFYAVTLGLFGILVLYFETNILAVLIAEIGLFFYVVVYSLWSKRQSVYGTAIGGISGAVPPVVGYCAATNSFDSGAWILFAILFFWQMPHFYSIAIFRLKDYRAAAIPVLPAKKGIRYTKFNMLIYLAGFTIAAIMPTLFGFTGSIYFVVALCIGLIWFFIGLQGITTNNDILWSRKMFGFSIIGITLLCVMMAIK